ncbi:MAG: MmcQ/YjbR family DNA-binding protein [Acidimicrobiia bacterium]
MRDEQRTREDAQCLERLRRICLAFPEAEEGTLQDRVLFHVRRRRFAIFNGADSPPRARWATSGRSVHFLTDPTERDALGPDHRFTVSPHHGDRGWLAFRVAPDTGAGDSTDWSELAELLEAAYRTAAPRSLVEQLETDG